ncbi:hypothetical protein [Micromonospora fulviviridis]|uniref:hypothetical protein n=1 Tax=Micromonospora fulviviridis TaxID=47860 RepID=UPI003792FDF9
MSKKRTVVALAAVAAAALTTLFLAGNGAASAGADQNTATGMHFSTDELRQLLGPDSAQRATADTIQPAVSIKEAVADGQFAAAPNLTSEPKACLNMTDALGDVSAYDGFIQSGERSQAAAPDSLQRYFMTAVFQIPGGADKAIDQVAEVLRTCSAGTIRLDTGTGKTLAGSISYAEHPAPSLDGARTFASTLTTTMPAPESANRTNDDIIVEPTCDAQLTLTANGDLLIWSVEPTEQLATDSVTTVYDRALSLS